MKEKRSRSKTSCPEELRRLLMLVNQFPPTDEMPEIDLPKEVFKLQVRTLLIEAIPNDLATMYWEENAASLIEKFFLERRGLGYKFLAHRFKDFEIRSIFLAMDHVQSLVTLRDAIVSGVSQDEIERLREKADLKKRTLISHRFESAEIKLKVYNGIRKTKIRLEQLAFEGRNLLEGGENRHLLELDETFDFEITDAGIIGLRMDPDSKLLQGLEVARIRNCKICRALFWAQRRDARCCGKKCSAARQKRKSKEWKETQMVAG